MTQKIICVWHHLIDDIFSIGTEKVISVSKGYLKGVYFFSFFT